MTEANPEPSEPTVTAVASPRRRWTKTWASIPYLPVLAAGLTPYYSGWLYVFAAGAIALSVVALLVCWPRKGSMAAAAIGLVLGVLIVVAGRTMSSRHASREAAERDAAVRFLRELAAGNTAAAASDMAVPVAAAALDPGVSLMQGFCGNLVRYHGKVTDIDVNPPADGRNYYGMIFATPVCADGERGPLVEVTLTDVAGVPKVRELSGAIPGGQYVVIGR